MATPEETLDKMLKDFEAANKTATTNPGKNFRDLIENTPQLKADILESIKKGNLDKFEAISGTSPLGYYDATGKALAVSADQLNDAARKTQTANSIRFTLGHEIQHGVNRQDILDQDKKLTDQAKATAKTPSPHDYTDELKAYNQTSRKIETTAEIAGFNTLASYVTAKNPKATLKDLYDASPDDMKMYIKQDLSASPPTYTAKPGLTIGADLKIASTKENVEAMGKLFYDANGYPRNEVGRALGMIQKEEGDALAAARRIDPKHAAPEIRVDLKELGLSGMRLPGGFTDSSRPRLQSEEGAGPSPGDPRHASHPDNGYFQSLRDKLPSSVPDNAVANAMLMAKKDGLTDFSKVNPDEVGVSNGKIWIGGNMPGFRVGTDAAQSPPMEDVAKDLQKLQQAQTPSTDPSRNLGQSEPQPASVGR
ncbi:MAG: hypothetical protein J0M09_03320 [Xanthomonadales bacterium]|nr:hypothetical protein [Xanthomonadales bacterium]